jgi:hypothetical protein
METTEPHELEEEYFGGMGGDIEDDMPPAPS